VYLADLAGALRQEFTFDGAESVLNSPEMRWHRYLGFKRKVLRQKVEVKRQNGPSV
jgi:hypothetical protein